MSEDNIDQARRLLVQFGMDGERSNERSALTLLALVHLRPEDDWSEASNPMVGTRALMDWMRDVYGRDYAPNTRETIRRYTLHQFADVMLLVQNPDQPDRPVNSPQWNYQIRSGSGRGSRSLLSGRSAVALLDDHAGGRLDRGSLSLARVPSGL